MDAITPTRERIRQERQRGGRIDGPRRDRQHDRPASRVVDRVGALFEADKLTANQYDAYRAFEGTCAVAFREQPSTGSYGQRIAGQDNSDRCHITEAIIASKRVDEALEAVGHPQARRLLLALVTTQKNMTELGQSIFDQPRSTAAAVAIQALQFAAFKLWQHYSAEIKRDKRRKRA